MLSEGRVGCRKKWLLPKVVEMLDKVPMTRKAACGSDLVQQFHDLL
ncbi:MAG: hypothetical protein ACI9EW_003360 [Cellvibrionaceae bacterium]